MKIVKKRISVDDENLIAPLAANGGVGEYLLYAPIYDQIREARREDDENLNQGIWTTDIKRADWVSVESLCAKAIEFQSKDLQIAGWITESWIVMDGLRGLLRGIQLIHNLSSTYWQNIYPQAEDNDLEARSLIYDWMNEHFTNRLMFVPLSQNVIQLDRNELTLADWVAALSFESFAKRAPDYNKAIADAESNGKITLSNFRKILTTTDVRFLQKLYSDSKQSLDELIELRDHLETRLGRITPTFSRIRTALEDISRITKTTLEQRQAPLEFDETEDDEPSNEYEVDVNDPKQTQQPSIETALAPDNVQTNITGSAAPKGDEDGVVTISGRRDAYQALDDIGQFLHKLDPHSPSPYLLEMIVSWENKSLPEILEDLSNMPTNTQMLLKMLATALPNTVQPVVSK